MKFHRIAGATACAVALGGPTVVRAQDTGPKTAPAGARRAPMLAWSFNRDGEMVPGMLEARDKTLGIRTPDKRRQRQDLRPLAWPQSGVDALKGKFGRPTQDIPGVSEQKAPAQPAAR